MTSSDAAHCHIAFRTDSEPVRFAVNHLTDALSGLGRTVIWRDLTTAETDPIPRLVIASKEDLDGLEFSSDLSIQPDIEPDGFAIRHTMVDGGPVTYVTATDERGIMYGALDLVERVQIYGSLCDVEEATLNPVASFRAIKFNLPWSPYRDGRQTEIHYDTCRDLNFWQDFLDMMARNRFNALTLWNLHPFPYMIRPEAFPEASPFSDAEFEEWRAFWHELFRMAANRGIETYIVNWNIHTTAEFAEIHDVHQYNDPAEVIQKYTRACITEVIDEYPNLTGLGTSVASWMENMTPEEKHDWILETFVEGIRRADRPIKLLHRSIKSQALDEMRRIIEAEAALQNVTEVLVPSKFNWSHGHSTTELSLTHDHKSGEVDDRLWSPPPEDYHIIWMVRNEDFFILRWGDSDFIREHIATNLNGEEHVSGYIVGSEGYIPAKDLSHQRHEHQTWQYAFEKQWLFYLLWGRLLYEPGTSDRVFELAFERRYGKGVGKQLLKAFRLASRMPRELASFHAGTWDYTLYAEGFLAPIETLGQDDETSPFISINEIIHHETLGPSYLSIPDFLESHLAGEQINEEMVTPLELADRLAEGGLDVLDIVDSLDAEQQTLHGAFECECSDLRTWAHLSLYFAEKLRAAVELETYRMTGMNRWKKAVEHLEQAADHWNTICDITNEHYQEVPYATDHWPGQTFSWEAYRDEVFRDIAIVRNARPYDYEPP